VPGLNPLVLASWSVGQENSGQGDVEGQPRFPGARKGGPLPLSRMAAGSDRFWLPELGVSRTFVDKLQPQLLRPWIHNSTPCQHFLSSLGAFPAA